MEWNGAYRYEGLESLLEGLGYNVRWRNWDEERFDSQRGRVLWNLIEGSATCRETSCRIEFRIDDFETRIFMTTRPMLTRHEQTQHAVRFAEHIEKEGGRL